jgi:Na+-transporting methylmalonyl-CoA/oxaloacetate decarboxylase gamma subunit
MMTSALTSLLIFFLSIGMGIVALVLGILLTLSYVGGWGALAREYASPPETDNKGALLEEKPQRKAWVGLTGLGRWSRRVVLSAGWN